MKQETFTLLLPTGGAAIVSRGEALRAMIAAIYEVSKVKPVFTTDDVYQRVVSAYISADHLRAATSGSRLIAVALRKARKLGYCAPTNTVVPTKDEASHGRPKRVWKGTLSLPGYTLL